MVKSLDMSSLQRLKDLTDLADASQENQVILLTVDQIEVKPQVRKDFKDIEELAASFDEEGQQTAIIVGPKDPNTGKYPLKMGGRRYAAAVLRPGFKLKAIVDAKQRSKAKGILAQVIENDQRQSLNPYEMGRAIADAKAEAKAAGEHLSNQAIAKYLGRSESFVSIHLGFADLSEELVDLIKFGITSDPEVLREMKQLKTLQPETFDAFIKKANAEGSISRQLVRDAVRLAKGKPVGGKEAGKGAVVPPVPPAAPDQTPVSHAKPAAKDVQINGNGHQPPQSPQSQPATGAQAAPAPAAAKKANGKGYTPISADRQVIGIRVAMDDTIVNGYLANDRVHDDPSKAWTVLLVGGSQQQKLVKVDQIEIVSVAAMAETN
ncbi:ParB/RepB/Spo0J family partition protein [Pseudomonas sp. NY15437]|uniref:ParB/RepB/Spo0J family partition protein n=1 Tax=Pseudomonas sp. NY15437 TaxID=3400360 RepID=UPI003A88C434